MMWNNTNYNTYNRLYFDEYVIRLKLENQLARIADVKKDFEEMNFQELVQEIASTTDATRRNYVQVELQKRWSLPFACLALTWLCAPLGLWVRSKGFIAFVLGIVMIFLYYLMFFLGEALSQRGTVSPYFGLWWANGFIVLTGFLLFYLVINEHSAFRFRWNLNRIRIPGIG